MMSGAMRRNPTPRRGRTAAGCARVKGTGALAGRRRPRCHVDAKVPADPGLAGGVTEGHVDAPPGGEPRGVDLEEMQAERVDGGLLLAHVPPAVEPPAEGR